jgi:hypothetical protein
MDKNNLLVASVLIIQAVLYGAGNYSHTKSFAALMGNENHVDAFISQDFLSVFFSHDSSFRTPSPLVPLDQTTSKYEQNMNEFAAGFAEVYQKHFSNKAGNYIMWLLVKLLANGEESWRVPSMVLLAHLMPIIFQGAKGWAIPDFAHLSHMARECMLDSNTVFSKAAETVMEFLQSHLNVTQLDSRDIAFIFVFMKPIQGYHGAVKAKAVDSETFIGAVIKERELARAEMLRRMWTQAFHLESDPNVNMEHYSALMAMTQYADDKPRTMLSSAAIIPQQM